MRSAQTASTKVVDVSYLHHKLSVATTCNVECDQPPGWEYVNGASSLNAPKVTHGKFSLVWYSSISFFILYTYLADCGGKRERGEAFRSLHAAWIQSLGIWEAL